ncbi:response regulator [Ideonella sp. B7]|uniref:adenylate/guanylate cyclase domain-containing protein n=1 Tax=Ideonella benzenivorans TaxID=2831643 RepID=UPI001CED7338|nr:response regulator [Ideonella benzenivorans]MCA6218158.1 response regulator [Ideonella benzenivorans]
MSRTPRLLVVDDQEKNRRLMEAMLVSRGYEVLLASGGQQGLAMALEHQPDLILLDVLMPDLDGFSVCAQLRALEGMQAVPVVMVTSLDAKEDRVRGLDVGADDFITKPVVKEELWARVRSLLRVKVLYDEAQRQRAELAAWSFTLEQRVSEKVQEVERLSQLKRFFSPALASRLVAGAQGDILRSHRREITVLFADLRGFSAYAERVDAQALMDMLREFHTAMGELVFQHEGTLERFTGDGFMVFFNDPDPQADHSLRAVKLALAMRDRARPLQARWQFLGGPAGLGIGLSRGEATLGAIGFEGRLDYAAIGSVTNRAARLCTAAQPGEILACDHAAQTVAGAVQFGPTRWLDLRGLGAGQACHPVLDLQPA